DVPFPTEARLWHTQIGWRMTNPQFPSEWTGALGFCAETVAQELGITRAQQDEWALRSHTLANEAWDAGLHDDYVLPVTGTTGTVRRDENTRPDTTREKLAALKPAFSKDGTATAGNSSPVNDGAIAVLVGSSRAASDLGTPIVGRIVASATAALEPQRFSV